jgi:hypothetical protein
VHFDAQGDQIPDLLVDLADLRMHQGANVTTGCSAAVSHSQDGFQLGEGKTDRQSALNQFDALLRGGRILPVVSVCSLRQRQEPKTLIVPQRIGAYAREMR